MEKVLIIVRGLPGSGKTTFAKMLGRAICCADDYLVTIDGKYEWAGSKLKKAHDWCNKKCELFMKKGISPIIIANTLPREKDLKEYFNLAELYGYVVFTIVMENRHGGKNIHEVPDENIEKMKKRFNIKLI